VGDPKYQAGMIRWNEKSQLLLYQVFGLTISQKLA
jgi:hypothetical protein